MSTLAYQHIKELIEEKQLISPADIDHCLGPASYELRIGSALSLGDRHAQQIEIGREFVMRPQSHLLIGTLETIKMPDNLAADLALKSKFGRRGFFPWSQGFVDPGYEGKLTLSLVNMSPNPVILSGGQKICHIVFTYLSASTEKGYSGEYNKSEEATGPKDNELSILGLPLKDIAAAGAGGVMSAMTENLLGRF
jgi:dCTP deaminase